MGNFIFENYGGIKGLYHVQPELHGDSRGYFMEAYNYNDFKKAVLLVVKSLTWLLIYAKVQKHRENGLV